MNRRRALVGLSSAPLLLSAGASRAQGAVQLGVLPHVSARVLLVNYQPLRSHLEKAFGKPVEIATAANFREYHTRAVAGAYDVAITAANLGHVAQLDGKLTASAIFEPRIPGFLIMLKDRPVQSVDSLRGRKLALANPASLIALKGMAWLREKGLVAGSDYGTVHAANEDSLGQLLSSGDAPLAMMSAGEFRAIPEAFRSRLEVFTEFTRVPGFMVMHRPGLAEADAGRLGAALPGFMATDDGQAFARLTGTREIRGIRADDLAFLADVVEETRRLLI